MLLNEIKFNITADVKWSEPYSNKHLGEFSFEGSTYQIDLNIVIIDVPSGRMKIVDIAFRKDGKSQLSNDGKPFRVFGPIINALRIQLPKLSPDAIAFGALEEDGSIERRKSIYGKFSFIASKTLGYEQMSKWFDIGRGSYAYMLKKNSEFDKKDIGALEDWLSALKDKLQ